MLFLILKSSFKDSIIIKNLKCFIINIIKTVFNKNKKNLKKKQVTEKHRHRFKSKSKLYYILFNIYNNNYNNYYFIKYLKISEIY